MFGSARRRRDLALAALARCSERSAGAVAPPATAVAAAPGLSFRAAPPTAPSDRFLGGAASVHGGLARLVGFLVVRLSRPRRAPGDRRRGGRRSFPDRCRRTPPGCRGARLRPVRGRCRRRVRRWSGRSTSSSTSRSSSRIATRVSRWLPLIRISRFKSDLSRGWIDTEDALLGGPAHRTRSMPRERVCCCNCIKEAGLGQ